jgi:hypothetical protein
VVHSTANPFTKSPPPCRIRFDHLPIDSRFDPENEGVVRADELRFVLANLPVKLTPAEIDEIVEAADTDADGKITYDEFRKMLGK